jgi:hypothetical protein
VSTAAVHIGARRTATDSHHRLVGVFAVSRPVWQILPPSAVREEG